MPEVERQVPLPPPINGTERYLAAILDELRAIRHALATPTPERDTVQLREPTPARKRGSR